MVDEFIYQFQSFAQYRGKLAQKSPHELELLKKCDGVWDLQGVLHYLQGLIDKSGIVRELASDGQYLNCLFLVAQTPYILSFPVPCILPLVYVVFQHREVICITSAGCERQIQQSQGRWSALILLSLSFCLSMCLVDTF